MYLDASERLLLDGVAGQDELESVDYFLNARTTADRLYSPVVATTLGLPEQTVRANFDAFEREGQLSSETEYVCPNCGVGVNARGLDESTKARDEYPCPGTCEEDLASIEDLELRSVYQLIMTPKGDSDPAT
jgi:DNA-directed RNA polymerase subunit RPC12/RpoP